MWGEALELSKLMLANVKPVTASLKVKVMVTSVSSKTMEVGLTTERMMGGLLPRREVARVALPVPALPAASVMPAMLTVIWTSSGALAGKVAGALRSTVQVVPPWVVRRLLSVPLPVGIVRSSMIKPGTGSEKLKVMGAVSPAVQSQSGGGREVGARGGGCGAAGGESGWVGGRVGGCVSAVEVLLRLMAGRSPAAGMAMRMVPPAFCVFGVGVRSKKELVPPASVALGTYPTVPGACEKPRPSSRRCTPVPRNTGLYVLSMKTVTLAVSPAWRVESFMRMLWATVCSFRWNGLVG